MKPQQQPGDMQNLQGNHACALGAVAAGCTFYAGYPITPSSEIAERMSLELPKIGGVFIQMEDEIASMGAILGASIGGAKAMTATSGPGFSLKQEHLGYASAAEIPCVIVNVMRGGPSTGMPTRPAQSDIMQARWGTHGDHTIIAITPSTVAEIYQQTIRAFNLSEVLRVPVVVLFDEVIGHLIESVDLDAVRPAPEDLRQRKWASGPSEDFLPYAETDDGVPVMARPGDGYRTHTTGLTHAENGFPTQDPATVDRISRRLLNKLDLHNELVESFETIHCEDAEVLIVAYGITARSARRALKQAREQGLKVGLFRPITLWPFAVQSFRQIASVAKHILVAEMNAGQLNIEIERHCAADTTVTSLNRIDGEVIAPSQILAKVQELLTNE